MEAAMQGDTEGLLAHYTDDIVLHYPGRNPLSGVHRGKDAIRTWMNKVEELLGEGGSLTRDLEDVLASDDHAVQLVAVKASRADGRSARWFAAVVMHFREGKISDMWVHIDDPYVVDELLS
jgi:ketosteroid isomerase-like protein